MCYFSKLEHNSPLQCEEQRIETLSKQINSHACMHACFKCMVLKDDTFGCFGVWSKGDNSF